MAITAGTDISAVKEMLGHGSETSTEVWPTDERSKSRDELAQSMPCKEEEDEVKVSLNKKIQAVNLTNGVFG